MTKLKWCIKRTPENYKEVNEWGNRNAGQELFTSSGGYIAYDINNSQMTIPKGFHEITLDEFRLLTDPEKYSEYSLYENHGSPNCAVMYYRTCIRGHEQGCGLVPHYPIVSKEVFNELQRMWKERESEKVIRVNETADGVEEVNAFKINGYNCRHTVEWIEADFMDDWRNQTKLGIQAMNKVIKALDKQNKLLRKLIKKQNTKRNEKTIM